MLDLVVSRIKTHVCVSCGPRNLGCATDKCVFTVVRKMPFSHIYSLTLPEQKHEIFCVNSLGVGHLQFQIWAESAKLFPRYAPSKFVLFSSYFSSPSSSFRNTFWNRYNSRMLWWIVLKFGSLLEHIRAYLQFNFCSNGIKKHGVIIDFQNF